MVQNSITQLSLSPKNIVKLPPINLPSFQGNYDSWLNFLDTYSALIHSNNSLSNVEKFYYLKSCLKGEAAGIIHSIEVTDLNYETAFKLVCERYENKKFIIQSHVKNLFELGMHDTIRCSKVSILWFPILDILNRYFESDILHVSTQVVAYRYHTIRQYLLISDFATFTDQCGRDNLVSRFFHSIFSFHYIQVPVSVRRLNRI